MLTIRLQRRGRKKLAQYRVVVQDSRHTPTSGKVVKYLGSYDPHSKAVTLDKDAAQKFLDNGAQPSDRVAGLLKAEGVALPSWVKANRTQSRKTKSPDKLRKNQPKEEPVAEEPAAETDKTPAKAEAEVETAAA